MMQITLCFMIDELHILIPHVFVKFPSLRSTWNVSYTNPSAPPVFRHRLFPADRKFLAEICSETGKPQLFFLGGGGSLVPWFLSVFFKPASLHNTSYAYEICCNHEICAPVQWGAMIHPGFMWWGEVYGAMIDALPQFVQ